MIRLLVVICTIAMSLAAGSAAWAQAIYGPPAPPGAGVGALGPMPMDALSAAAGLAGPLPREAAQPDLLGNPVAALEASARAIPGVEGGLSGALNILVLMTVLTLVPTIVVMCTCFIRFVIVLGLLKTALGTQSLPPSQVLVALALFMTILVMSPTLDRIQKEAIGPYQRGEIADQLVVWEKAKQPVRDFMFAQIEAADNWSSLYMVLNYRGVDTSSPETIRRGDVDMLALIPAYMLSELKVAFLLGFKIYLPFLIIDMVIASLLISMSMMMLPPVVISLPFKLLLFVMVDGWELVVGGLMQGVALGSAAAVALGPPLAGAAPA